MKMLYYGLLAIAVIAFVVGLATDNLAIGGTVTVIAAVAASAVAPNGRGLSRYWQNTDGD